MFDMLTGKYKNLASKGRNGDTMLAHINPQEAALLKSMGGAGTINPQTGLREFYGTGQLREMGLLPAPYQAPFGSYDMRSAPPPAPAPFDRAFADIVQGGYGSQRVTGYTLPTDKTFEGKPLVAKADAQGNFKFYTMQGADYLVPDPSQPNIISQPRLNAQGEVIDYGVVDLSKQDSGGFGSMISELGTEFAPMIAAAIGANLGLSSGLFPGAGAAGAAAPAAAPAAAGALSPYAAQAAGAYGGSAAAAQAAAAGSLAGIQAASSAQNALTAEALARTGLTYGGNVTPADIPTTTPPAEATTTPPAEVPVTPPAEVPVTPPAEVPVTPPVVPPTVDPLAAANISGGLTTDAVTRAAAAAASGTGLLSSLGDVGTAIMDFATKNPSIAGSLLGAVTGAIGAANAPKEATTQSNIDPQLKAEYLANIERAKTTAADLGVRQFAEPGAMYTDAEKRLYNLGMTPFGAEDIARFYNPYQEQVVQGALGDIERTRQIQEQANMEQATRARAFGGSRQGVVSGMTNEAALRQAATTGAQLRSAGFNTAANLGLAARPLDIAGLQTSLGLGTARTALEQARLDALRNLGTERLAITSGSLGIGIPNIGGSTSQPLYSNTAGSALSGGLTGAYIGSLLQPRQT